MNPLIRQYALLYARRKRPPNTGIRAQRKPGAPTPPRNTGGAPPWQAAPNPIRILPVPGPDLNRKVSIGTGQGGLYY